MFWDDQWFDRNHVGRHCHSGKEVGLSGIEQQRFVETLCHIDLAFFQKLAFSVE
jgi:hypothetical protein